MLFVMAASLYSSRVVLNILGVSDYGLYNVVGGVVAMLSFINGAASSGTSRFLSFYLGKGDVKSYQQAFSAAFYIHLSAAVLILLIGEPLGLWFINNELIIDPDRLNAAHVVFHISILTCFVTFTQVPYNASIISHEKMDIYAYVGIVEAVMKLLILYVLKESPYDKLKTYSVLLLCVSIVIALFYRFYCVYSYKECRLTKVDNLKMFKDLLSYSGWDMYGNISGIAQTQGINVVINMFLATTVNAARGVAYQVDAAVTNFITNFLTAVNPQIVKAYASGDNGRMLSLIFNSCKYSFLLFSCLAVPLILCADYILHLWLVNPPKYAIIFTQLVLMNHFISILSQPLLIGNHATGNVKRLNLISGSVALFKLPMAYVLLKLSLDPIWIFVGIIPISFICLNTNLFLLRDDVFFSIKLFYKKTVISAILIMLGPVVLAYIINSCMDDSFIKLVCVIIAYVLSLSIVLYKWGIPTIYKTKIKQKVNQLISAIK